ncbi:MobF family relaxase [Paenirhodobacter populi]|uniref:Conjugative relaxase n=1 Tax=Paenirhodobacter populi TaxID=2306993 RepID=A0A443JR04_9RHOB|nr:MobF family relaxase [Sinirhodobacter populi]RWR22931.1 conjugative relaxase [Sinirhodobacter populi]
MMSLSNVSPGAAASGYYQAEGYYIAGSPEALAAASWFGKAAEHLADIGWDTFRERVDNELFSDMLQGYAPGLERDAEGNWKEGQTLGRWVGGERQHRPGIDLTFSASKSVSIMALVGGDERIVAAHDRAVKLAMAVAEERFVYTRREVNGEIVPVHGKMIAGLFRHDTSRALDPQLHTHAVIQNMVLGPDGRWTALTNEPLYENKMLLGSIYRNGLARELTELGYTVDRVGPAGIVEIRGVPQELMDGFSKRRQEIEAALKDYGAEPTARDSALAALATRKSKHKGIDRAELKEGWLKEARDLGIAREDLDRIRDDASLSKALRLPGMTRDGPVVIGEEDKAAAAIDFAIRHVSERNAVYSADDLLKVALNHNSEVGHDRLEDAILRKEAEGRLVPVHLHEQREVAIATPKVEGIHGTLKSHGPAPYKHQDGQKGSYFVTLETSQGEKTLWGVALAGAIERAALETGDTVALKIVASDPVRVRDGEGWKEITRNDWIAEKVEAQPERQTRIETEIRSLYTDDATLAAEVRVQEEFRAGRRADGVILPDRLRENGGVKMSGVATLRERLNQSTLTEGQRDAILTGLSPSGRFVAVQGYAGTGKTYMVEQLRSYAERFGYMVEGAAPTNRAVAELEKVLPGSRTVARFKLDADLERDPADKSKTILVIDESSMIGTTDMRDLMGRANQAGYARVILLGDIKQLDAVAAGTPFAQLQRAGMPTALMADIQRQRDEGLRDAVLYAIRGEINAAFANLSEVATPARNQKFTDKVANSWLELKPSERERTGLIVLTNAVREEVNAAIREGLRGEGRIAANDTQIRSLAPHNFTKAEAAEAASYRINDVVVPIRDVKGVGLTGNTLYKVTDTSLRSNTITLRPEDGGLAIRVPLVAGGKAAASLIAYSPVERDFAPGDRVKFALTDRASGVANGARGSVEQIGAGQIEILLDDGKRTRLAFDSLAARGIDHAYAATAHDFQGATVDRIIVGMMGKEQLSTQKSFYVGLSRARDEVMLITTKVSELAKQIQKQTGERPAALDAWERRLRDEGREREMAEKHRQPREQDARTAAPQEHNTAKTPDRASGDPEERQAATQPERQTGSPPDRRAATTPDRPVAEPAERQPAASARLPAIAPDRQPARDPGNTEEILRDQYAALKRAERPPERNERDVARTIQEIEQMQKVKEGPIR